MELHDKDFKALVFSMLKEIKENRKRSKGNQEDNIRTKQEFE